MAQNKGTRPAGSQRQTPHEASSRSYDILVVGAGTVGKATGSGLISKGHRVAFVDINPEVTRDLGARNMNAFLWEELEWHFKNKSTRYDFGHPDIVMFSVSTPFVEGKGLNLHHFKSAVTRYATLMKEIPKYQLLVFRSTITPGTSRELVSEIERITSKKAGRDFGVCMQPEFLRARKAGEDFLNPWFTLIGEYDKRSGDMLEELYRGWSGEVSRTDFETAEFAKLVHNCFNAVKISFSNEMWLVGKSLGLDSDQALRLASKSAEGYWNPSYGIEGGRPYGGACLPKDLKGFLDFVIKKGMEPEILKATDVTNEKMEEFTLESVPKVKSVPQNQPARPVLDS